MRISDWSSDVCSSDLLSVAQTYFHNALGISADFNKEHYENGQKALLPGDVRLQVDPMAVYGDGTPDAGLTGAPYSDGRSEERRGGKEGVRSCRSRETT